MKILLSYYHPVIEDLAITLTKLGHEVTISISIGNKDHYGDWKDKPQEVTERLKEYGIKAYSTHACATLMKNKRFDLLGVDGVFIDDSFLMDVAKSVNIPYFCINGYPNCYEEPSNNILSLGWGLPLYRYNHLFIHEGAKKEIDWKSIAETGKTADSKNICIFYPNFWKLKEMVSPYTGIDRYINGTIISGIQKYAQYNFYSYEAFNKIKNNLPSFLRIENFEEMKHDYFIAELQFARALMMLKWADAPGISLFEAQLLGAPVYTLSSYVLASYNQDVLIDGYNAIVADTTDELILRITNQNSSHCREMGKNSVSHSYMLTDFNRQKDKLQTFLERCL